jgi:parvulin-like peptidyl-prolyl isomerase
MLYVVFLAAVVGQVPPPPPVPATSVPAGVASAELPAAPQAQREWLLARLIVDMQAQGKYDAQKYLEIQRMLDNVSDSQVAALVSYYQERKAQVQAVQAAQAEAELRRLQAYRDRLRAEVEQRKQVYQQQQAAAAYSSALAAQQTRWVMLNIQAAQAWPYYAYPWPHAAYRPHCGPHHHHHHR